MRRDLDGHTAPDEIGFETASATGVTFGLSDHSVEIRIRSWQMQINVAQHPKATTKGTRSLGREGAGFERCASLMASVKL